MELCTVELNNIKFDAYYTYDIVKDPYGTGDSPTQIDITIQEISLPNNATDLLTVIDDYWLEKAREQIADEIRGY